ncbi:MAG TPA: amidohydrolase family protein [Flavisolibacter sp.]|nr:amidohydrolase family protein [Flavisolibacter sp.]
MQYRKFSADRIFTGYRLVEDQVLIIGSEGEVIDLVPSAEAGDSVQRLEGILVPGFVNCHCHLELSHMKGMIPEGTGLVDFVYRIVTGRHHTEAEIIQAISYAEEEMIQSGIVAVGDICNTALTLSQKKKGHLQYYNFIEASGWLPSIAEARFNRSLDLFKQFSELPGGMAATSIVPHAPYSVSKALWELLQAQYRNRVVSMHNQETAFEDEFFLHGTGDFNRMYKLMNIDNSHHRPSGLSSIRSCYSLLSNAASLILVHNTFMGENDADFVMEQAGRSGPLPYFCLCINANLYIEKALPPVAMLREKNAAIVLGTDSLASNWQLSIVEEINTLLENFPLLGLEEVLAWATINGAKALQMEGKLGSFEKGKNPGLVVLTEERGKFKSSILK